jgi:hypothetical protein
MAWVIWHPAEMKKKRKSKKRKPQKDVNQLAAALVQRTISESEK